MLNIINLRCEYTKNPIGIDEKAPRFSWILDSDGTNILQASYRIQVSQNSKSFERTLWDSGEVVSDQSIQVEYHGPSLKSETRYFFRVKACDSGGAESPWSDAALFETGILNPDEWLADFISADSEKKPPFSSKCPMLRKEFDVGGKIKSARIYVTCLGLYELRLNGKKVGDYCLTPGWTSYNKRLQYQTYDVTSHLKSGNNAIGALLGNGWYKGYLADWMEKGRKKYGARTALLAELHITYEDGRKQVVKTDNSWRTSFGPILMSEIYHGETYDARLEMPGWDCTGFDDSKWNGVYPIEFPKDLLTAQEDTPVMRMEILKPVSLFQTPKGELVLDFGQNMVGWVKFHASGAPGDHVTLQHFEVLDSDGNVYTENLRKARQTVDYILRGKEEEWFEPHFTYQGFRYIQIVDFPGTPSMNQFEGIVLHSGMETTGSFSCSHALINQLQHNILWGQKGNFVDIPTDCPQRDERLGWTGDAQIFVRTSCFNMNTATFFKKWLRDLKSDQRDNGEVPFVVPHVMSDKDFASSGWGDAAVICPWTMYLCYDDLRILEQQYDSMKGWVEYIRGQSVNNIWKSGFHFGDWLALDKTGGSSFKGLLNLEDKKEDYFGATPNDYVSTAYYAYSTQLLAKAARLLGKADECREYAKLHEDIVKEFQNEYITPSGRLAERTQTAYVLALMFGLVREADTGRLVKELLENLEENNWHLTTGFLGTPYLCHVLSKYGHADAAYKLLLQTDYPSWLYQVTKGATTIWEHWDGLKPDGTFWSKDMNSFNHYAYGSIGQWLYDTVAGLDIDESAPAYKHIIFRPTPNPSLQWAEASYQSMYGAISIRWATLDDRLSLDLKVPHNTTASLAVPGPAPALILEKGLPVKNRPGLQMNICGGKMKIELGSGDYSFSFPFSHQ